MIQNVLLCVLHNSRPLLTDFVASIQELLADTQWRVLFVDSGSTDGCATEAGRLAPTASVLELKGNLGFAAGINRGVREVPADVYVVINPDVRPSPGCLPAIAAAAGSKRTGLACPRLLDEHGELLPSLRHQPTAVRAWAEALLGGPTANRFGLPTETVYRPSSYDHAHAQASWATGGLLAFTSAAWRAVGGWDESYFLYEEEVAFCVAASDRGYRLAYEPSATAVRIIGDDPVTPWAEALMRTNRVRHLRRRRGAAYSEVVRLALLLGTGLRAVRGRPESAAAFRALLRGSTPAEIMWEHAGHRMVL